MLTCKSYRARVDGENIILEIDNAQPANFVPQQMSRIDVASRLNISVRKVGRSLNQAGCRSFVLMVRSGLKKKMFCAF